MWDCPSSWNRNVFFKSNFAVIKYKNYLTLALKSFLRSERVYRKTIPLKGSIGKKNHLAYCDKNVYTKHLMKRNRNDTRRLRSTKASNAMIEDPRLAVDTMERTSQQFVPEKRANHVLKPVPSQQYQQECYQHEPQHQQQHYQRHHHHGQPHGQYTLQVRYIPDKIKTNYLCIVHTTSNSSLSFLFLFALSSSRFLFSFCLGLPLYL